VALLQVTTLASSTTDLPDRLTAEKSKTLPRRDLVENNLQKNIISEEENINREHPKKRKYVKKIDKKKLNINYMIRKIRKIRKNQRK
jgi:hypothetical protein